MSRRLVRVWLLPVLLVASNAWALGLGDIRLESALNQPLRAEIELLSATPEELNNLDVQLASVETFQRYGLDRPTFLTRIQFTVERSGRADGNVIRVTSLEPVTEPFITFLVEAIWSRGRLLREYTLLLDPPTFAPPPVADTTQAVTAPSRAQPADSGVIERPSESQPTPEPAPTPQPSPTIAAPTTTTETPVAEEPAPASEPIAPPATEPSVEPPPDTLAEPDFDTTPGGDVVVVRGDTLWGIAGRMRPDSRLSMNQTMLAIYEANLDAFGGNINVLRAGASLRIPSADEMFRISRSEALAEAQRHHAEWEGAPDVAPQQPTLTLVPPDDDVVTFDDELSAADTGLEPAVPEAVDDFAPPDRETEIQNLLDDYDDGLIEIEDNELAALRAELAALRGEELPADDAAADLAADEPIADDPIADDLAADDQLADDDLLVDDETGDIAAAEDDIVAEDEAVVDEELAAESTSPRVVSAPAREEPGLVDTILNAVTGFWGALGAILVVVLGVLVWFARRAARGGDDEATGMWETLEAEALDTDSVTATEPGDLGDDDDTSIVVVEQEPLRDTGAMTATAADTLEMPAEPAPDVGAPAVSADPTTATGVNPALEDTFSSETAINLDQSDPIAEADFHMAYGLYDQAADLINGALEIDPQRQDLLAKLCEIYFVWGNRDAFIDAAVRLRATVGDESNADWDKTVIMGRQIAADHELFSGVSAGAATKAVDLSFEGGTEETGALDMDLAAGGPDGVVSDVIDLGAESAELPAVEGGEDLDLEGAVDLEVSVTQEMPRAEADAPTTESSTDEPSVQTPTIEEQFDVLEATGELPSVAPAAADDATEVASLDEAMEAGSADATAEIDLDDLGLDLDSLGDGGVDLEDTAESQTLKLDDDLAETGTNEAIDEGAGASAPDPDATEVADVSGIRESFATEGAGIDLDATDTNEALADVEDTDTGIDTSLLDATGMTQVLGADMAVETASDIGASLSDDDKTMLAPGGDDTADVLPDDAETLLAPLGDDDGDFDFAKTEALPKDVFTSDADTADTGRMQAMAGSTDMDLDLDDLTAALKVSEVGDTVNQVRDDKTVEQPRINREHTVDLDVGAVLDDDGPTETLAPEDVSGDLHDARTMTEVGTKLDLARAYVDMGDPRGARSILEEVLDEGDEGQRQQAQQLLDSLPT